MRINKFLSLILITALILPFSGCGKVSGTPFNTYGYAEKYGLVNTSSVETPGNTTLDPFSWNFCVTDGTDKNLENTDSQVAASALEINNTTDELLYSKSCFQSVYPASTTKIMTCLLALESGISLDTTFTISENACNQPSDSTTINLNPGDVISLRNLLYGMMLNSGNDAAIAVAEAVGGDVDTFVNMMNEKAVALGATKTHFVNPNGLQDVNHFTTAYDMYLIFREALKNSDFINIINIQVYDSIYTDAAGNQKEAIYKNTNQYINGKRKSPDGVTVVGGKTGTTGDAGYCLVLYSTNTNGEDIISIVFGADARTNMYLLMKEMLEGFANGGTA